MNKDQWIDRGLLDAFEAEGTDAHRLCTADNGWVERFGRDILISFRTTAARERSIAGLKEWAKSVDFPISRVFARSGQQRHYSPRRFARFKRARAAAA